MICFRPSQLETVGADIFEAIGAPRDIAEQVARSLVQSNLMGHDSHGVMRITRYVSAFEKGALIPSARPVVSKDTATTAVVDGAWGFGNVTASFSTELALAKAERANMAAVGMIRCNHIGRLGEYAEMAARKGMIAFMLGSIYSRQGNTAPYGGSRRILGTNPISFGVPTGQSAPIVVDIATSASAEGKLSVARSKKQQIEPGIILDKHGNPSTDPNDYYEGGTLLPFGGHKGYGLSVVAELLGMYLSGGEAHVTGSVSSFSHLILAIKVEAFRPLAEFQSLVDARLAQIKAVPPASGFTEVLLPGEPEQRMQAQRRESGILLPEETWKGISEIAAQLKVAVPAGQEV